jgi:hypothetical protein
MCVPRTFVKSCSQNLERAKAIKAHNRHCQRALDLQSGVTQGIDKKFRETLSDLQQANQQIGSLKQQQRDATKPWVWLSLGAGLALLSVVGLFVIFN